MAIDKQNEELILDAISNDDFPSLRELIENGLNIDLKFTDGDSILHKCFAERKYNLTQHLILLGADIYSLDKFSRTPLHLATRSGFYEGCNLYTLLTKRINQQDHKGRTPLMHAIKHKQMLLVKMLMGKGSDTDLKDSNGFTSLMWAIKFLDPQELKALMAETDDETLQEQIAEAIENQEKIEVADEILSMINSDEETDAQLENILPSPIQEMMDKPEAEELIASYSITEHIESLKEKSEEEGFAYEIAALPKDASEEEVFAYSTNTEETQNKEDIEGEGADSAESSQTIEDGGPQEREEVNRVSSNDPDILESEEIQRVSSGDIKVLDQEEIQRVQSKEVETKEAFDPSKIDMDQYEVTPGEAIQRSTSTPSITIPEPAQIIRPETQISTIKGEAEDIAKDKNWTGEGSVDQIKEEFSTVKSLDGENAQEEQWSTKSPKQSDEESAEYKIEKIKRPESVETPQESDTLKVKSAIDKNENDDPIIIKKKEVTYLRDGYRDEIKDEYGKIVSADKNVTQETELGEIKTVDKKIGDDQYGEITDADKVVRPDHEIREIEPGKNQKIESTVVEGKITENHEKIEISHQEIKTLDQAPRPERPQIPTSSPVEIERVKRGDSNSAQGNDEGWAVKSSDSPQEKESDTLVVKTIETEESTEEESQIVSGVTQEKEETTIVEGDSQPKEGELTSEEEETLNQTVDVNEKNKKGQTLCWISAQKGQLELLKRLIQKGADFEIKDTKGISPFMIAAINGQVEVIEYLCEKVRNVDEKRTDGQTALTLAIEHDRSEVVRALIDGGASSDTKIKGSTLLMHAASFDSVNCIKILIMFGHDPTEKNFRGKTAMDLAKAAKKKRSFMMLKKIIQSRQTQEGGE